MTTRTKRTAKPRQIEALIGSDRVLLKELMKGRAHGGPGRVSIRVLQPRLGDADWEVGAPGAAGSGGAWRASSMRSCNAFDLLDSAGTRQA